MGLSRILGFLVVFLSSITLILGIVNVAITCSRIIPQCVVTPIDAVPTFLYLTYTGVAIWASILNAVTGLYATSDIKDDKKDITRFATFTFLSCFLFVPAIIGINVAESYFFQETFPVKDYVLNVDDPYLLKLSINAAIASFGLIVFIPLFALFTIVFCCPTRLTNNKKTTKNKKKVTSTTTNDK